MTISYSGRFGALLFRWKASLWKSVWKELLIFLTLYYSIACVYRFTLQEEQKIIFAKIAGTLDVLTASSIPIYFLLGNYVVTIVKRWWEQFENIAWPDEFLLLISAFITDSVDPNAKTIRRNIARYTILSAILAWRNLSARVLKRFPTAHHLTRGGIMTEEELVLYQAMQAPYGRWFLPLDWIQTILTEFRDAGKIDSSQYNRLLNELHAYRKKFIRLFICDWIRSGDRIGNGNKHEDNFYRSLEAITTPPPSSSLCSILARLVTGPQVFAESFNILARREEFAEFRCLVLTVTNCIPLVYTQVATVATYGYFAVCLISRQQISPEHAVKDHWVDIYIPFATIVQFLLYFGWLKVGEKLMHPFGEEDDDFELNYIIDRHLYVGYMIVDEIHGTKPASYATRDPYEGEKPTLPYTRASTRVANHTPGSVQAPKLLFDEMELILNRESSLISHPTGISLATMNSNHFVSEQNASFKATDLNKNIF